MKNISLHRFYRILKRGKIWRCKRNLRNKNIELIRGGLYPNTRELCKATKFFHCGWCMEGGDYSSHGRMLWCCVLVGGQECTRNSHKWDVLSGAEV